MSPLVTAEIVLAVAFALVLFAVVFVWVRRRYIAGGQPLMVCALSTPEGRWRLGLAKIAGEELDWFSVVGPSLRPERSWARHDLDLGAPQRLADPVPGLPQDAVTVTGRSGEREYDLALSRPAYTALRAWLESSPPGFNVNVA